MSFVFVSLFFYCLLRVAVAEEEKSPQKHARQHPTRPVRMGIRSKGVKNPLSKKHFSVARVKLENLLSKRNSFASFGFSPAFFLSPVAFTSLHQQQTSRVRL